jgi:hypothetical protein
MLPTLAFLLLSLHSPLFPAKAPPDAPVNAPLTSRGAPNPATQGDRSRVP